MLPTACRSRSRKSSGDFILRNYLKTLDRADE